MSRLSPRRLALVACLPLLLVGCSSAPNQSGGLSGAAGAVAPVSLSPDAAVPALQPVQDPARAAALTREPLVFGAPSQSLLAAVRAEQPASDVRVATVDLDGDRVDEVLVLAGAQPESCASTPCALHLYAFDGQRYRHHATPLTGTVASLSVSLPQGTGTRRVLSAQGGAIAFDGRRVTGS